MRDRDRLSIDIERGSEESTAAAKIKYRILSVLFISFFLVINAFPASAQEAGQTLPDKPSTAKKGDKLKLSLRDAIKTALVNNLDIAAERFSPQIAETAVAAARAAFHPTLFTGIDGERSVRPSASRIFATESSASSDFDFNAGLKAKLITGGTVEFRYDSNRNRTNSSFVTMTPTLSTDLTLTVTQPLLRDYGISINRSNIEISENQKAIAELELASRVNDIVAQTETSYWALVSAIEILKVRQRSLELAQELLRKNKIQVEVGVLAPVEILQAEAVVAAREEAIINARVAIKDAEDRLKRIMNPQGYKDVWKTAILPTDKPPFVEKQPTLDKILQQAFDNRYDYRQAKIDLRNRGIKVDVAKNGMLPRVDLVGGFGLNGLSGETTAAGLTALGGRSAFDGNFTDSLHELFSGDFYSWQIGLSLEYPLGNVARRSEFTRRKLEQKQATTKLNNLELIIQEQVRKAARRVQGDLERVKATRVASELARERLEAEEKKFEVGISTNFEVLELQEDVAIAENNEVRALIDYNQSLVELQRVTATLLDNKNIKIE
jgi:outer membrane protein TolC